jgi:hydrogenase maturation protein HypF
VGSMATRAQILVKGIVQGVGFRPFVFTLAESLGLAGYVLNRADGVVIDAEGERLNEFVVRLRNEAPPLSRITDFVVTPLPLHGFQDFTIHESSETDEESSFTLVSPDVSLCDDCRRELLDPADRRYLYPFINCTNCGPRYSITLSVPYDRSFTTMAGFPLCPECRKEYKDPRNRRFHAQPNACPKCGPQVEFRDRSSADRGIRGQAPFGAAEGGAVRAAISALKDGGIVAVKGIGGFHLACDATNADAVRRLRERKRKSNKPFAIMASDVNAIRQFCEVTAEEEALLLSKNRPIVLLEKKDAYSLPESISPNNQYIGSMLPYTPLHLLLFFHPLQGNVLPVNPHFRALVMTSGNLSEEPIVCDNNDALRKLGDIVDGFLLHNRDIFMRVDDSVVRIQHATSTMQREEKRTSDSELFFIRRSRGYAPDPIALASDGPEVLGCGADLKNTFTLTKGRFAVPSQHIGDMENYETLKFFEEVLENLKTVYRVEPREIVHDLHPGYLSTKWAEEESARLKIETHGVQHHYAHIGSVMAEHGLTDKVIGVAMDGTGYGIDGNLWGAEFIVAGTDGFNRAGQFKYVPLPGGEAAIREPWRTAVSYLMEAAGGNAEQFLERTGFLKQYGADALQTVMQIARASEFSPLSSGAGRLFDAVSALVGICDRNTFEGEAAMALEAATREGIDGDYPVEFQEANEYTVVDFSPAIRGLVADLDGLAKSVIATKFHNTIAMVIGEIVARISRRTGICDAALSGGTFQNLYLLKRAVAGLSRRGIRTYVNHQVPCNDACISLGQAYLIRERLKRSG